MEIANKIQILRKKTNMSQEELSNKIEVTRQTISNWENGISAPDIKQAKDLAKVFNVTLDELVGNEIRDALIKKTTNIEKLAGMTIKFIEILIFLIVVAIISIIFFANHFRTKSIGQSIVTYCKLNDDINYYQVKFDNNGNILSVDSDGNCLNAININIEEYKKPEDLLKYIEDTIESKGGECDTSKYYDPNKQIR